MCFTVRPLLNGAPDDVAMVCPTCGALGFLEQNQATHEGTAIATGVAQQGPASGRINLAKFLLVGVRFPGVVPAEFTLKLACRHIKTEHKWRDTRRPFEHVQLRPYQKGVFQRLMRTQFFGQLSVAHAVGVTHAGEDAPGMLGSQ